MFTTAGERADEVENMLALGSGAAISSDERYRYCLVRRWGPLSGKGVPLWVMLNPSTADAELDDPTIRRCIGFAKREGFGGMLVANLFALRATNPGELVVADDPIGPSNPTWLEELVALDVVTAVWAGWGTKAALAFKTRTLFEDTRVDVCQAADAAGLTVHCLGLTKAGDPKHPLYVKGDAPLIPWR